MLFGLEIYVLSALDFPSNFPDFFTGCNADGGGGNYVIIIIIIIIIIMLIQIR